MADNVIVRVPEQQIIRGEDGKDGASAYEQAVAGGYTGTEAQFNEELASFKELSDETKEAAPFYAEYFVTTKEEIEAAINYKRQIFLRPNQYSSYFAQFAGSFWYIESGISGTGYRFITTIGASQTVFELKNSWSFRTYNLNAPAERAEAAAATALTRMNSADTSAKAAAKTATTFAEQTVPAAVSTINEAKADALTAVGNAQTTAVGAVQQESTTQQAAIQQKGDDVLESIPSDYTELSEDVDDLKSATNAASKVEYLMIPYAISSIGNTKYIVREDGGHCAVFNVNQNTDYIIKVSGNNNRFRFYGLNDAQALTDHFDYRTNLDGIIADTSTDSSIDSKTTYTINSGNYRAVVVYLGAELSDFSATLEITPAIGSSFVISNSFLPDTLLKSAYSGRVHPFVVPAFEPYGDWKNYTSDQLITNVYEPLRAANPYYISRSVIGKDASGTYDIYQYTFEPDYYEQTIYLQSGVHARETDAYITLAKMMQMICNNYEGNEELSYLRFGCKIVVVPIVNVWGVSNAPYGSRGDVNANGKNLNRDLRPTLKPVYNGQAETIAVKNLVRQIMETDTISFALDLHTTTNNSYGDYMLTVWTGSKNEIIAKRALYMLARMNAPRRLSSYLTEYNLNQYELRLPYVGDSDNAGTYAEWFNTLGIPCATIEHSDYVFDTERCTVTTTSLCLQNFFTQLINHAEAKFPILMKP